ncbi:response regulator transcription factor [Teichococcus aestuarii]|uniref:response regulator transcription factor n=2 Tax=Teichococcus aestuarii TaxID=568898 RepID=UPI0036191DB1
MKKILVVEDEIVVAMSMEMVLESEGFAVMLASDGRDGLVLAERETPDLIITDLMMPRMDGMMMIARIREIGSATPIALTTWVPEGKVNATSQRSYDAFLPKPFSDSELLAVVRQLLDGAALSRTQEEG